MGRRHEIPKETTEDRRFFGGGGWRLGVWRFTRRQIFVVALVVVGVALCAAIGVVPATAHAQAVIDFRLENDQLLEITPEGYPQTQILSSDGLSRSTMRPQHKLFAPQAPDLSLSTDTLGEGGGLSEDGEGAAVTGGRATSLGLAMGMNAEFTGSTQVIVIPVTWYPFVDGNRWVRGFSVQIDMPIVHRITRLRYSSIDPEQPPPPSSKGAAWGLGDVALSLSYQLRWRNFTGLVSTTVKFPTGNENKTRNGVHTPLGTGSYDFIVSASFGFSFRWARQVNSLSYRYNGPARISLPAVPGSTTEGGQAVDTVFRISQGANIIATTGVEFTPLVDGLWLGTAFNYFYVGTSTRNGVDERNHLHLLELALPYVFYDIVSNVRFEAALSFALWGHYGKGITAGKTFTENIRGSAGIRVLF